MDRFEADLRASTAVIKLKEHGWTESDIERAADGLRRDEVVEELERHASQVNPAFRREVQS